AALVQSPERLKLLLILTVCDIKAVGPGVWNNWKAQLLRTLFYETEPRLAGGHSRVSHTERVAAAKAELSDALSDWPEVERLAYLERHYRPYWLRVDIASKVAHAALVRAADRERRRLATAVEVRSRHDVTVITVLAPDHPRVLQVIAGACTVAGANIVDAQIFTTTDGLALDSIAISREFADDNDETRRAKRISDLIERALTGTERLPDRVARKLAGKPGTRPFTVPTEVHIDNASSEQFTVLEVAGLDRPGLLYDLTRALSDLNLNITSAHIATFGERVVDVFYLTGLAGQKITAAATQAAIRRRVHQAFDGPPTQARLADPDPEAAVAAGTAADDRAAGKSAPRDGDKAEGRPAAARADADKTAATGKAAAARADAGKGEAGKGETGKSETGK
ncbi:ACT domain-containing protein, partial [Pseudoxanthobacter sp.]|uniref:ACT domain-containing protein n=1 Tax=Pseudoxanthobacter sp. TaxID=1925742 RepID=UPI002FE2A661